MNVHKSNTFGGSPSVPRDVNHLLDVLIDKLNLKNDAALCRTLRVVPPVISKLRHGKMSVGPALLITMHEESGISIKELRTLMGDTTDRFHKSEPMKQKGNRKVGLDQTPLSRRAPVSSYDASTEWSNPDARPGVN
jgi:hypothetical protein